MNKSETLRAATEVAGQLLLVGAIGTVVRLARLWGEAAAAVREIRDR